MIRNQYQMIQTRSCEDADYRFRLLPLIFLHLIIVITSLYSFFELATATDFSVTINQIDASQAPNIRAYVTVADAEGRPLSNLDKTAFRLSEENTPVQDFEVVRIMQESMPISILLAIDNSGSMKGKPLEDAKGAAIQFISSCGTSDQIAVYVFNDRTGVISQFSSNKDHLVAAVGSLQTEGSFTLLYETIFDAVKAIAGLPTGRKAIVVMTDGKDENSKLLEDDCIKKANELNVPVFTVGFGSNVYTQPLGRIAKLTGGQYFYAPTSGGLSLLYQSILEQLKNQYLIKFHSPLTVGKATRRLTVAVTQMGSTKEDSRVYTLTVSTSSRNYLIWFVGVGVAGIAIIAIAKAVRKKTYKTCPKCGREMDPTWQECLFCTKENVEEIPGQEVGKSIRKQTERIEDIPFNLGILFQVEGQTRSREYRLDKESTSIGRDKENDVVLQDETISGKHCKIKLEQDTFVLYDFGTTNGSFVNDERVDTRKELKDEDKIRLGKTEFVFKQVIAIPKKPS